MAKKILFIRPASSSFMITDEEILKKEYDVRTFVIGSNRGMLHFSSRILQMITFVISNGFRSRAIVTWFADYHAAVLVFLGKIIRKKVIIFAGGQEAICYPDLRKGVYLKKFRGMMVRYALRHAAHIIPNHESLIWHENFFNYDGKKDGIRYYVPGIKTPMTVIHNGINPEKFFRDTSIHREDQTVMTIGTMSTIYDFINKGFDLFIEMARRNQYLQFILVGMNRNFLPWIEEHHPFSDLINLEVFYYVSPYDVIFRNLNRAKVFVQASITEGMPNTLGEAMLCGCIPVGSSVNGIPDVIGDTGIIIRKRKIEELEEAVRKALKMSTSEAAIERIHQKFSMKLREEKVLELFRNEIGI